MKTPNRCPHESRDRLGVRILGLPRATNHQICAPSCSPQLSPAIWDFHSPNFQGPKSKHMYSQLLPPSKPRSLGVRIVGLPIQGPKIAKCVRPAAPLIKAQIAWEYAFSDFRFKALKFQNVYHRLGVRIVGLSVQGPKIIRCVRRAVSPSKPRSLGSMHFRTFDSRP